MTRPAFGPPGQGPRQTRDAASLPRQRRGRHTAPKEPSLWDDEDDDDRPGNAPPRDHWHDNRRDGWNDGWNERRDDWHERRDDWHERRDGVRRDDPAGYRPSPYEAWRSDLPRTGPQPVETPSAGLRAQHRSRRPRRSNPWERASSSWLLPALAGSMVLALLAWLLLIGSSPATPVVPLSFGW